jgi:cation:H+ antiporter
MVVTAVLLLASAGVIYIACEAFTNGIEWLGQKLGVSQTATGTILAALGTALPESVVTLVATAFADDDAQRDVGVGAALGGPLALSTIAYAAVGVALIVYGRRSGRGPGLVVRVDGRRLSHDQLLFLAIFAAKIALGLWAFSIKPWLGMVFLAVYAWYVIVEMSGPREEHEGAPEPLLIRRGQHDPHLGWVVGQTVASLALVFAASHVFVGQLEAVGPWLGLQPQVTALLLSPIATELPETMNALIWVRQGKERLALANVSGAMMIQATVPTAFGLFFTPWLLDNSLLVAAGATAAAVGFLSIAFRRGEVRAASLSKVGWLYAVFAVVACLVR